MLNNFKIWAALAVAVFFVIAAAWQVANVRGIRARGRRRGHRGDDRLEVERSSDQKVLSRPERKMFKQAQKMRAAGNIVPAARILEQLSLQREAIQMLEDHGFIHDAAKILMRMQRHNRAGVVYARHGLWDYAGQCFKLAHMPLEVAKCAREAGHLDVAAEHYELAGRPAEAAECYEAIKRPKRAAKLFMLADMPERAMAMYDSLAKNTQHLASLEIDDHELKQIVDYLGSGHTEQGLAALVAQRGKLKEVMLTLLGHGMTKQVSDLLVGAPSDLAPLLMAEINDQTPSAVALAEVFMASGNFAYGGMMYERMGAFNRAAMAFEKAADLTRAVYCYERAGNTAKADALRGRSPSEKSRPLVAQGQKNFSLTELTEATAGSTAELTQGEGEHTQILDGEEATSTRSDSSLESTATHENLLPPIQLKIGVPPPPLSAAAAASVAPPKRPEQGFTAMQKTNFCAELDAAQCRKLWDIGKSQVYAPDTTILSYNDEPRGIYIILYGSVSCYKQLGGKEAYIDQMVESESFGELWLLADQPTSVHFIATKATEIRLIERGAFNALLDKDGALARKLYKRFTARLLSRLLKTSNHRQNLLAS